MTETHRLAYIMSRFPGLSETFILREMCGLEDRGWHLELYPLILQQEKVVHQEAVGWMNRAHQPDWTDIIRANLRLFFSKPILYLAVLLHIFFGNLRSPKFLSRSLFLFPKAVWMARQMYLGGIAHVHAHYATHPALAAWIINKLTDIPYSITVHAHDIFVDKCMLARKLSDAKKIVAISQFNRKYLIDHVGILIGKKIEVIHCGVDAGIYALKSHPENPPHGEYNILSIGSLRSYKGFWYLLEAAQILKQRGVTFCCRIVGGGELYDSLQARIAELDLEDCVELLGPKAQNEVAELLKGANCYVQPSVITATGKMEGIPVSIMEALATELPVIATNISGVPELVIHKKTGYLVPPQDAQQLAGALQYVISNPVEAKTWGQAGRKHVMAEFNIADNVALLSDLFKSFFEEQQWK